MIPRRFAERKAEWMRPADRPRLCEIPHDRASDQHRRPNPMATGLLDNPPTA